MGNYLNNRLKYHTASRVAIETMQPLAAAMNVDGHVVTDTQVWTSPVTDFPVNGVNYKSSTDVVNTTKDLIDVFTNSRTPSDTITKTAFKDGFIWRNTAYPAVELYDAVKMQAVLYSDGPESAKDSKGNATAQAYEIVDSNNIRVTEWVPPTAVIDSVTGAPVPGYSGYGEVYDGKEWIILQQSAKGSYAWALANGTWEFVFKSGMLTFDPAYTPTCATMGYSAVRFTGFKYIGETLSNTIKELSAGAGVISSMMAIKPFEFSLDKMTKAEVEGANPTYSIDIPGFVFNLVNNVTGMAMGDIEYTSDGGSKVVFVDLDATVLADAKSFTAFAFVKNDGSKITVLDKQTI